MFRLGSLPRVDAALASIFRLPALSEGAERAIHLCEISAPDSVRTEPPMPQLFLDCDGVLADFDSYATGLLGMPPREFEARHGPKRFWQRIAGHEDFFFKLPLLPDARLLWDAVAHLRPVILTGLPQGNWAAPQKMRWAAQHFPEARMITTAARAKRDHMERPGDILVDDLLKYRSLWEEAGGIFVHHRSARETLDHLAGLGLDVARP